MLRVTADTNILISALNFSGAPAVFLRLAAARKFQLVLSDDIVRELADVLQRPKFGWPEERISTAVASLRNFAENVTPGFRLAVVQRDESDNRILECATAGKSDVIVSGDRDLLDLKLYDAIPIVTVRSFLESSVERDG